MKYRNCNQIRDHILFGNNLKGIIKFINKEIDNRLKKRSKGIDTFNVSDLLVLEVYATLTLGFKQKDISRVANLCINNLLPYIMDVMEGNKEANYLVNLSTLKIEQIYDELKNNESSTSHQISSIAVILCYFYKYFETPRMNEVLVDAKKHSSEQCVELLLSYLERVRVEQENKRKQEEIEAKKKTIEKSAKQIETNTPKNESKKIQFPNGYYEGENSNGIPNGKGVFYQYIKQMKVYEYKYIGEWINGKKEGVFERYGIDTDGSYSLKAFEIYKNDEMKHSYFVHALKQKGITTKEKFIKYINNNQSVSSSNKKSQTNRTINEDVPVGTIIPTKTDIDNYYGPYAITGAGKVPDGEGKFYEYDNPLGECTYEHIGEWMEGKRHGIFIRNKNTRGWKNLELYSFDVYDRGKLVDRYYASDLKKEGVYDLAQFKKFYSGVRQQRAKAWRESEAYKNSQADKPDWRIEYREKERQRELEEQRKRNEWYEEKRKQEAYRKEREEKARERYNAQQEWVRKQNNY